MVVEQTAQYLSRREVANFLGVSQRTIDRWIKLGILKAKKFGGKRASAVRISKADFEAFLQSREGH